MLAAWWMMELNLQSVSFNHCREREQNKVRSVDRNISNVTSRLRGNMKKNSRLRHQVVTLIYYVHLSHSDTSLDARKAARWPFLTLSNCFYTNPHRLWRKQQSSSVQVSFLRILETPAELHRFRNVKVNVKKVPVSSLLHRHWWFCVFTGCEV